MVGRRAASGPVRPFSRFPSPHFKTNWSGNRIRLFNIAVSHIELKRNEIRFTMSRTRVQFPGARDERPVEFVYGKYGPMPYNRSRLPIYSSIRGGADDDDDAVHSEQSESENRKYEKRENEEQEQ